MGSLLKAILGTTAGKGGLFGIIFSVGWFFVKNILQKQGVSTNLKFLIESLVSHNTGLKSLPDEAIQQAKAIEKIFEEHRLLPCRIAIDGVPGSGKSTLARALSARLGMETICLDHQNMDEQHFFAQAPAIYEHHRLLRTQDIDRFDVIVYIDQPVSISKQHILQRERGAYLVDIVDFDLLKRIGDKAFALAEGKLISIDNSFVKIKIRPETGFKVMTNLAEALQVKRVKDSMPLGLNEEEQLFLLVEGLPRKGFMAYVNPHAYEKEFISALSEDIAGSFTKRRLWR